MIDYVVDDSVYRTRYSDSVLTLRPECCVAAAAACARKTFITSGEITVISRESGGSRT